MSFEGYYQYLCPKGHYFTVDAYSDGPDIKCPFCNADEQLLMNLVDLTNGNTAGKIRMDELLITPAPKCECCNQIIQKVPALYRVPSFEEWKTLRTFTYDDGTVVKMDQM